MKMTITAKKMQIPQNFTEYAEKRLNSKLNKFFGEEADAKITMATHKNLIVIELTVDYNNMKYSAFKDVAYEDVVPESDYEVIRHKKFVMHPMDVEEAILQMNLLGHTFFMFLNANTGETNVVYKRADGKYAVLEPVAE